jgi:membrane-bound metal-dependent hydrolase YbcI (DUF457 family)
MFVGHFGLSFAAKKVAPKVSLGTMFIATQFVDILWPFLLIFHVEKVAIVPNYTKTNALEFLYFPYTHSLLMGVVWGIVVGGIYWLIKKDKRGALIVGLGVLSHWLLDLIVHTADLPLTPFSDYKVGFGLWNQVLIAQIVEIALFLAGLYIYATFTKAKNKIGKWAFWSLAIFLLIFNFANTFGPPPPNSLMTLFVSSVVLMAIIAGLAYWVDRNREAA